MTSGRLLRLALIGLLGLATRSVPAQHRLQVAEPPEPIKLRIVETYLQTDVEVEHEVQKAGASSPSITRDRLQVQPVVGVGFAGSIYHPNLLEFEAKPELGLNWQSASMDPGGSQNDTQFFQRYHAAATLLREKPYQTAFFADKDMSYRDYDFFTRVRTDSQRYGARSGYSQGLVPFSISVQHYDEEQKELTRPATYSEDSLALSAQNFHRAGKGRTMLSYNLSDYERRDDGFSHQTGLVQNLTISDVEDFGSHTNTHLNSLLSYNSTSKTPVPTDKVLLQENLYIQHTPRLRSFYDYAFDTSSAGSSDTVTHQGRAGLGHQLYENLASTFDVHAITSSSSSPGSTSDTRRYGTTLSEQYTRRISDWGRISLGYTGNYDHEERDASGQVLVIIDETHVLTDGTLTFLRQPQVAPGSLNVTDSTGTILYLPGLDYLTIQHGLLTEIQRVPGGTILNGGTVLVDYTAILEPSSAFDTVAHAVSFRLDFYRGLLGLYVRWNKRDYHGGDNLILRTLDDLIVGADSSWRWLRLGAEYEISKSNLAPYERISLRQGADFHPMAGNTIGLEFDQSWTTFRDTHTRQTTYGAIGRMQQQFSAHLSFLAEAGVRFERGNTYDRDVATARAGLDWTYGKLSVKVGYEYRSESHYASLQERHYFFMRARRDL